MTPEDDGLLHDRIHEFTGRVRVGRTARATDLEPIAAICHADRCRAFVLIAERDELRAALRELIDMDDRDFAGIAFRASEYLDWLDRARELLGEAT